MKGKRLGKRKAATGGKGKAAPARRAVDKGNLAKLTTVKRARQGQGAQKLERFFATNAKARRLVEDWLTLRAEPDGTTWSMMDLFRELQNEHALPMCVSTSLRYYMMRNYPAEYQKALGLN